MTQPERASDPLGRVLADELPHPVYLTRHEVEGGWRELFPELAACLPTPYPIYAKDEEEILTYGYPVLLSPGMHTLLADVERHLGVETEYRLALALEGSGDKARVMAERERYLRTLTAVISNALLNDYGRGLVEVFLLFHSIDLQGALARVPRLVRRRHPSADRDLAEELRHAIAAVCADLVHRAAVAAADGLRRLPRATATPTLSPLVGLLCQNPLLLVAANPAPRLENLDAYLRSRFHQRASALTSVCRGALARLAELVEATPELGRVLAGDRTCAIDCHRTATLLEPRLLTALVESGIAERIELSADQTRLLHELALSLKAHELLYALRRRVARIEPRGAEQLLLGPTPAPAIADSTRPFDFAAPGVVSSWVHRFGLVYDLSSFTAILEEVRKEGRAAEEKALEFMYVFQGELEEIRRRRRLHFEKFLGDGALYSSRQAAWVVAAACEIQQLYDQLRHSGFPFDQGLRIAINFGSYRLLPMVVHGGPVRFEFFGHGIVELSRLTTGKSTREVEEIAEFLVHSGYEPETVDGFLRPLLSARDGGGESAARRYEARIDADGALVNEGIVLTVPLLEELARELEGEPLSVVEWDGLSWAVLAPEPSTSAELRVALRYLGVARLKGLQPLELVEAAVWTEPPGNDAPELVVERPLIALLRRLAKQGPSEPADDERARIPESLVVATFVVPGGRRWVFGTYRASDDVLLHAIEVPIEPADLAESEPLEAWLFRHRHELATLYEGLRRESSGVATPLESLRRRDGFLGCYLAAPHRSPG